MVEKWHMWSHVKHGEFFISICIKLHKKCIWSGSGEPETSLFGVSLRSISTTIHSLSGNPPTNQNDVVLHMRNKSLHHKVSLSMTGRYLQNQSMHTPVLTEQEAKKYANLCNVTVDTVNS